MQEKIGQINLLRHKGNSKRLNMRLGLIILFLLFNLSISDLADAAMPSAPQDFMLANKTTREIHQHGITWTFAEPVEYGQFANGDYWVLDSGAGVSIVQIEPLSTEISGRIMHGSMVNPSNSKNGYDSSIAQIQFDPSLNVGRPAGEELSVNNPLVIHDDSSLVSTRTHRDPAKRPQLVDAAVLTVLKTAPPSGSFRPPYAGNDKIPRWNISDIKWHLLPRLPNSLISNQPDLELLASKIERVWLDHGGGIWTGRYLHPSNNMPDYGRDMANVTGDIALALLFDFDRTTLTPLMISFLQLGIDWYGVTESMSNILEVSTQGGLWMGGGGHGHGRKWPIAFAGIMFNDTDILKYADASVYPIFQEEQQFFYVTQADVDQQRYTVDGRPRVPYASTMIGEAEWGEQHLNAPQRDGSNWDASYRDIVSKSIASHALAATIMNTKGIWKWDSFFDYQDRWAKYRKETGQTITYSSFADEVWATFRYHITQ
ncbi:MAG: hypothetical protein WBB19_00125 [Desulforhopalus sp.]